MFSLWWRGEEEEETQRQTEADETYAWDLIVVPMLH